MADTSHTAETPPDGVQGGGRGRGHFRDRCRPGGVGVGARGGSEGSPVRCVSDRADNSAVTKPHVPLLKRPRG